MRLFKKVLYLCLFLTLFSFVGCKTKTEKQMPATMPKDFNFIFKYGVGSKNIIDTSIGQFTRDMAMDPSITTDLNLSEDEMNIIYQEMIKTNILSYPESFNTNSNLHQTPYSTYSIKFTYDGKVKTIFWSDENASKAKAAVRLRELFHKIEDIIMNKEEFKNLPQPRGGYAQKESPNRLSFKFLFLLLFISSYLLIR